MAKNIYVDAEWCDDDNIINFIYTDLDNEEESVTLDTKDATLVALVDARKEESYLVYIQDVPKLILALQAAYDYKEK